MPNTTIIHGRNLIASDDQSIIGASKSCTLRITNELIEVSSATSGKWRSRKSGKQDWHVSCGCFLTDLAGTAVAVGSRLLMTVETSSTDQLQGYALVEVCEYVGNVGQLAQYTIELSGDGELAPPSNTTT